MIIRTLGIFGLLSALALVLGCASSEELKTVGDRVYSFDDRMGTLEMKVNQLSASLAEMNTRLSSVDAKVDMLAGIDRKGSGASNEIMLLEQEISKLEKRIASMEGTGKGSPATPQASMKNIPVKVLAGGTNLDETKLMAKRLVDRGYNVVVVDYSNSPVTEDTVYFMKGYAEEAKKLASVVGPMARTKPITWDSSFKLIAVKGARK